QAGGARRHRWPRRLGPGLPGRGARALQDRRRRIRRAQARAPKGQGRARGNLAGRRPGLRAGQDPLDHQGRRAHRPGPHQACRAVRLSKALVAKAADALSQLLAFSEPADERLSRFFRAHHELGQQDRAFVAETVFAVLRRLRSLELAAGGRSPRLLVLAALVRLQGVSARALQGIVAQEEVPALAGLRRSRTEDLAPAVRADLPDWLWERLVQEQGADDAMRRAQGLLNPAPLDLRINLARTTREAVLDTLRRDGIEGEPTPWSPAGVRLAGKPAINRHALFRDGLVEVQDEGSQLLAWLLAPRRGEMIADYCAGAGGKTLAAAMLMRGTGRIYAM